MKGSIVRTVRPFSSSLITGSIIGALWAVDAWRRGRRSRRLHRTLIDLLLNALHSGDPRTERHSRRVADLTDALADAFGLSSAQRARARIAALLHDLGKLDDEIYELVNSGGGLSDQERRTVRGHSAESASILRPLENVHPGISEIVAAHHENWDGSGYPNGMHGRGIPLEARILTVADVFDALTQPRSYREPMESDEALKTIERDSGNQFDPEVVRRVRSPEVLAKWLEIVAKGRIDEARHADLDAAGDDDGDDSTGRLAGAANG